MTDGKIVSLFAQGMSIEKLAEILAKDNMITKTQARTIVENVILESQLKNTENNRV